MRFRRARHLWFSPHVWRARLAFWGGALLVGLAAVGFAVLADIVQKLALRGFAAHPLAPLLVTPAVFAVSAFVADRFFPGSQGSGIPQAMAARRMDRDGNRGGLLSPKLAVGKVALTLLGLLGGASIGREGPTVQVGASIMLATAKISGLKAADGVVLAGSAAGLAAAFNTPLAGIVFAIEEMARAYEQRASGLVLVAVVVAGIAAIACLGNYEYFGHSSVSLGVGYGFLPVLAVGGIGGLLGGGFSRGVLACGTLVRNRLPVLLRRPVLFGLVAGLLVAVIGVVSGGETFGTGYHQARAALEADIPLPWWYAPMKLLATAVSTMSGIPGGLFAPSLSVGAGVGSFIAQFFASTPAEAVVMLGLVAYLVGVTQAPMTGFVIVMEMTGNHYMMVPLMATAVVAYGTSRLVCPWPLYHEMARRILVATQRTRVPARALPMAPAAEPSAGTPPATSAGEGPAAG